LSEPLSPEEAAALERAIAPLRDAFREKLPGRLAEIDARLAAARGGDRAALAEANRLAHTLKGTAGSYGFDAVSRAAGEIEALTEPDAAPSASDAALDDALAALRDAVAGAGA